jgi:hypothetical protein
LVSERVVHFQEYLVSLAPYRDSALVIAGARADQGFNQPVPLWRPADVTI